LATLQAGGSHAFEIRRAKPEDAAPLAALATQLGYPSTTEDVERRLEPILKDSEHAVFVAQLAGRVVAWLHVHLCHLVESELSAEIGGLVVEEGCRRSGAGRLLMKRAEDWACRKGCRAVTLRSNVVRKEAHLFYTKLGYPNIKTQHSYRKLL
jgi:GNAT superfamily N-acetyltransferase